MDWKYYIPHEWNKPTTVWEDIWLWPIGLKIDGNMGNRINLTIDALGSLLEDYNSKIVEIARRLQSDERPYWIWPYPGIEWNDSESMIVNCSEFSKSDILRYAKIYLEHKGFVVNNLFEATVEEAFADIDDELHE